MTSWGSASAPADVPLDAVARAAVSAGLGALEALAPLRNGGANHRAYRARVAGRDVFVKEYFRPEAARRDRLAAEWAFAQLAWHGGAAGAVAEPLALDRRGAVALWAWVDGRRLAPGEITAPHVDAALAFVERLAGARRLAAAGAIADAAESCFSIEEHLAVVASRVETLASAAEEPARTFARERLAPAWRRLAARVTGEASEHGLDVRALLATEKRCLSPSDFGFHNALVRSDDTVVFHDFEYAGWDDPAKLVGDFFAQVGVPVDEVFVPSFVDRLCVALGLEAADRTRIELLAPVYRMKWCCIVLNEMLPASAARRAFAARASISDERKRAQLAKAETMLSAMGEA